MFYENRHHAVSWRNKNKTSDLASYTVVGDNINIMKTTFELNFDFYQALNSIDTQKYGNKEKLSI